MRTAAPARSAALTLVVALVVVAAGLGVSTVAAAPAQATAGRNDYPATLAAGTIDPWRFYARTCTSFVAWRMNHDNGIAFTDMMGGGRWGNATNWDANARALGYRVDTTPAVGAIAQWHGSEMPGSGGSGHVAWVDQVNADGTVLVEEYNYTTRHGYDQRVTTAPRYLHVADLGGPGGGPTTSTGPSSTTAVSGVTTGPGLPGGPGPSVPPSTTAATTTTTTTRPPATTTSAPVTTTTVAPPAGPGPTPFPTAAAFLQRSYADLLGRPPRSAELASWTGRLAAGTAGPDDVVSALVASGPLTSAMAPVIRLYQAFFQRLPDQGGLRYWYAKVAGGTSLPSVAAAFARSREFATTYGPLADAGFVFLVYRNTLHRDADPDGAAYWMRRLAAGASRGDVMVGFSESPEYVGTQAARVGVLLLYEGLLGHQPSPAELTYWSTVLANPKFGPTVLARALRLTPEYASRVR